MSMSKFVEIGRRGLPAVRAAGGRVVAALAAVHPPHAAAECERCWVTVASLGTSPAAHRQAGGRLQAYGYLEGNTNFDFSFAELLILMHV